MGATIVILLGALLVYIVFTLVSDDNKGVLPDKDHTLVVSGKECWMVQEDDHSTYDSGTYIRMEEATIKLRDPDVKAVAVRNTDWTRAKEILQEPDLDLETCFRDEPYRE